MWQNKSKAASSSATLKAKVSTKSPAGEILTPDGLQIMVGTVGDQVLIFLDEASLWNNMTKYPIV